MMTGARKTFAVALAVATSALWPATAQDSPSKHDLAVRMLETSEAESFQGISATVEKMLVGIPPSQQEWARNELTSVSQLLLEEFKPLLSEHIVGMLEARFSLVELQHLLAMQTFLRRPEVNKALRAASEVTSDEAKYAAAKEYLSDTEIEQLVGYLSSSLGEKFLLEMRSLGGQVADELRDRLVATLRSRCSAAPPGIVWCK